MRAVLISIQPKWCEMIASKKKTVEVRRTKPKLDPPFKVYIYMTAGDASYPVTINGSPYTCHNNGGMNVIGEFVCDRIDTVYPFERSKGVFLNTFTDTCLSTDEYMEYAIGKTTYFWHISSLVIYDKPKSIRSFYRACKQPSGTDCSRCIDLRENNCKVITRGPQSWCYVEALDE